MTFKFAREMGLRFDSNSRIGQALWYCRVSRSRKKVGMCWSEKQPRYQASHYLRMWNRTYTWPLPAECEYDNIELLVLPTVWIRGD